MDKRLIRLLQSGKIGRGNLYLLDTYNQTVHKDVACTIRTNINTANHHFIMEKKPSKNDCKVVIIGNIYGANYGSSFAGNVYDKNELCPSIMTSQGGNREPMIVEPIACAMRGRNPDNPSERAKSNGKYKQRIEMGSNISNTITSVQKDSLVAEPICLNSKVDGKQPSLADRIYDTNGIATCVTTGFHPNIAEPQVLTPKRTEFGKQVRKQYESGELDMSRHDMTELQPRTDGITNTITSVQKDNLIAEPNPIIIDDYNQRIPEEQDVIGTVTTQFGNSAIRHGFKIAEPIIIDDTMGFDGEPRIYENYSPALRSERSGLNVAEPLRILQATEQGYVEVPEGSVFDGSYPNSKTRRGRLQDGGKVTPTITANGEPLNYYEGKKESNYRIRKLTERECFRLMGVSETNIDKIQASGVSRSQQYKMAGNSIVVDVLEHIFRKMFVDTHQESQQLSLF